MRRAAHKLRTSPWKLLLIFSISIDGFGFAFTVIRSCSAFGRVPSAPPHAFALRGPFARTSNVVAASARVPSKGCSGDVPDTAPPPSPSAPSALALETRCLIHIFHDALRRLLATPSADDAEWQLETVAAAAAASASAVDESVARLFV